jgi:primase-polymerase (primpol)-like protein
LAKLFLCRFFEIKETKLGISFRKLFENWDRRFETETLDEFRDHLEASVRRRQRSLQAERDGLTDDQFLDSRDIEGYRMHLEDQMSEIWDVQHLADELSILALYKQVELHTKRVAIKNFSASEIDKIFDYQPMTNSRPFDITTLADFAPCVRIDVASLNSKISTGGRRKDTQ